MSNQQQHSKNAANSGPPRMATGGGRDVRATGDSSAALEKQLKMERLALEEDITDTFPKRPNFGQEGRRCKLVSNCFGINFQPGVTVHLYDVAVESKKAGNKRKNRLAVAQILKDRKDVFPDRFVAYDGEKLLYSLQPLNRVPLKQKLEVIFEGKKIELEVQVKHASSVNLKDLFDFLQYKKGFAPQHAVSAINVILRHKPSLTIMPVGRSFFPPMSQQADTTDLGRGAVLSLGYHQTVQPTLSAGLVLNIDVAALAFYKPLPLLQFVEEFFERRLNNEQMRPNDLSRLNDVLKGLLIETTHLVKNRTFKIFCVNKANAQQVSFDQELPDGNKVKTTVAAYFVSQYKSPLKYPLLPLLQIGSSRPIHLPMEVCRIVEGQPFKKLDPQQTASMIRITACKPGDRFYKIQQNLQMCKDINKDFIDKFGISISDKNVEIEGRVLNAPAICYADSKTVSPSDGAWDMRGNRFINPAVVGDWALVTFSDNRNLGQNEVNKLKDMLMKFGSDLGVSFGRCLVERGDMRNVNGTLQNIRQKIPNLKLAVCILCENRFGLNVHDDVKMVFDSVPGLATQCILDKNVVKKCNPPLVKNLLLQINAKAGGTNNIVPVAECISFSNRPYMVIGVDLVHPAPGDADKLSVAAAVGSINPSLSRFHAAFSLQNPVFSSTDGEKSLSDKEVVSNLSVMVKSLLLAFHKNTKAKPLHIIIYRDGVSDGQMPTVKKYEMEALNRCFLELEKSGNYKPTITFIAVKKRHHSRFMNAQGRGANMDPGTVIDKGVVHPVYFDFFLCSHKGIQGTSTPVRYTVLHDENRFSPDHIQKFTHYLTHLYSASTRSISVPAPLRYADLAASRAKMFLKGAQIMDSSEVTPDLVNKVVQSLSFTH